VQKGVPSGVLNERKPVPIAKAKAARMAKPVRAVVDAGRFLPGEWLLTRLVEDER